MTVCDYDVAIIGFGPVGAMLAGLLGKRDVNVVILERDLEVFPLPRAAHLDHTALRTIQELGCLHNVLPDMIRNRRLDLVNADLEVLVRIPADQASVSNLPTSAYFYQPDFDQQLRQCVASMPTVEARLGTEMTSISQSVDQVAITAVSQDGAVEQISAGWAVGCDGASSVVRGQIGVHLESLNFNENWFVVDLLVEDPPPNLPKDHAIEVCDPMRPYLTTPISKTRQRFEFMMLPGEEPDAGEQFDRVRPVLERWLQPDNYTVERAAIYTFHGLIADTWRKDRILLAGDAAHQTPPFLGQGMCAGVRDATNLAWKLSRVIDASAPRALLDTYQRERDPHARAVVEAAIGFGEIICELDHDKAAARDSALLAEGTAADDRIRFRLPNLETGPLILDGGGALFVQPHVDGKPLDEVVGPEFLVLARTSAALGTTHEWWRTEIGALVLTFDDMVHDDIAAWFDRYDADVVVVRPDRHVLATDSILDRITEQVKPWFTT